MNKIIEELRSKYDSLKAEENRIKSELSDNRSEQRNIVGYYIQQLNGQFAKYINKKVTIETWSGRKITGFFCGFMSGYNDLDFVAYVDLAKIKKDGTPSVNHYKYYDSAKYSKNLKLTICDE